MSNTNTEHADPFLLYRNRIQATVVQRGREVARFQLKQSDMKLLETTAKKQQDEACVFVEEDVRKS